MHTVLSILFSAINLKATFLLGLVAPLSGRVICLKYIKCGSFYIHCTTLTCFKNIILLKQLFLAMTVEYYFINEPYTRNYQNNKCDQAHFQFLIGLVHDHGKYYTPIILRFKVQNKLSAWCGALGAQY